MWRDILASVGDHIGQHICQMWLYHGLMPR